MTPTSNVLTGAVPSLARHPLPRLLAAGVRCSISSDDPVLMNTHLSRECTLATGLGHAPRNMFAHALAGAFCDDGLKARLHAVGEAFDWGKAGA